MKVLQIISTAYRATLEEQDDTILWLTQSMKGAGGDFNVLLTGNAANYAVQGQDASGLAFGDWRQTEPPRIEEDLARILAKGIPVYAVADDLTDRGLMDTALVKGVVRINRTDIPRLMNSCDRVWRW